jgi:hypothetical protein
VPHNQASSFHGHAVNPLDEHSYSMVYSGHSISDHSALENGETAHMHLTKATDVPNGSLPPADNTSNISRSFQSDSDAYIDREWRHPLVSYPNHYQNDDADPRFPVLTSSPTSFGSSINSPDNRSFNSPFDFDYIPDRQAFAPSMDLQSSTWGPTDSELDSQSFDCSSQAHLDPRRWFGFNKDKSSTKGLNPDAKEFSLFRKPPASIFTSASHARGLPSANTGAKANTVSGGGGYDALNPNGLGSMTSTATSSTNQSLLRAFAPSPAEREALQRALGGSTNTSFERLPSLSDVGSIPASPTNAHALPHAHIASHHHPGGRDLGSLLPAWLQALPRGRKVNFSPWDDEEPSPPSTAHVHDGAKAKEGTVRRS